MDLLFALEDSPMLHKPSISGESQSDWEIFLDHFMVGSTDDQSFILSFMTQL